MDEETEAAAKALCEKLDAASSIIMANWINNSEAKKGSG
jgi:hypothetical protein